MILLSFLVLAVFYLLTVGVKKLFIPDHTQWHKHTFRRTPLDEGTARHRRLCLTTHNTHKLQTSMLPTVFEPTITGIGRRQNNAWDRAATGSAANKFFLFKIFQTDRENHSTSHWSGTGVLIRRLFDQDLKLTTYLHLMPIFKTRGAISESPNTLSLNGYGKLCIFFDYVFLKHWHFQHMN